MNAMDAVFFLELSPAELHWLAGAFAITRLPLPEDPSRFLTVDEWKSRLVNAPATLKERGLLAGSAQTGWQIDRLPGAIVRWLGSASNMLRLDVHMSDGASLCANIFSENDASMQVRMVGTVYEFVLFPERGATINHFLHSLGASQIESTDAIKKYAFPQPLVIISAAWKDPALAAKMLKVSRSGTDDIKSILAWAETLKWTAGLRCVQLDEADAQAQNQTVLCGNEQIAWAGATGKLTNDSVEFFPVDLEGIRDTIRRLL